MKPPLALQRCDELLLFSLLYPVLYMTRKSMGALIASFYAVFPFWSP